MNLKFISYRFNNLTFELYTTNLIMLTNYKFRLRTLTQRSDTIIYFNLFCWIKIITMYIYNILYLNKKRCNWFKLTPLSAYPSLHL
jgi:hypothetical protein